MNSNISVLALLGACAATVLALGCAAASEDVESEEGFQTGGRAAAPDVQPTKPLGPLRATCTASEDLVFSCSTSAEQKIVICAAKDLSSTAGYIQARVEGKTEVAMSVPEDGVRTKFRAGARAVVTERGSYLQFDDAGSGRSYLAYDLSGGAPRAGIVVSSGGTTKEHLTCDPGFVSKLGKSLFDRAGLKYGKSEPQIPTVDR